MITEAQKEAFQHRGLIQLKNFFPAERINRARDVFLQHLETQGIRDKNSWLVDQFPALDDWSASGNMIRELKKHPALVDIPGDEMPQVISELLDGQSVHPTVSYPAILFSMPNTTRWTIPHKGWHLDMPRIPYPGSPGAQYFTFLNSVAAQGGGTLIVTGSHRLLNLNKHIRSKDVRKGLKKIPYFRELLSAKVSDPLRFMDEPQKVDDIELQVVELTGDPGDVYLMDLRVFHCVSPNASQQPRIMLTQRYPLQSVQSVLNER